MDVKAMINDSVGEALAPLLTLFGLGSGGAKTPPAPPPAQLPTSTQLAQQPQQGQQGQTEEHPVLKAAFAAGVETADDFAALKANSDAYAKGIGDDLKAEATRKFGAEKGLTKFTNYSKMSLEDQKAVTAEWREENDDKFGIGKNGEAADRQTAAGELAQSKSNANAEQAGANTTGGNQNGNGSGSGSGSGDSAWAKLSKDEQAFATKMGYTTPEAREKFATEAIRLKGAAK